MCVFHVGVALLVSKGAATLPSGGQCADTHRLSPQPVPTTQTIKTNDVYWPFFQGTFSVPLRSLIVIFSLKNGTSINKGVDSSYLGSSINSSKLFPFIYYIKVVVV